MLKVQTVKPRVNSPNMFFQTERNDSHMSVKVLNCSRKYVTYMHTSIIRHSDTKVVKKADNQLRGLNVYGKPDIQAYGFAAYASGPTFYL